MSNRRHSARCKTKKRTLYGLFAETLKERRRLVMLLRTLPLTYAQIDEVLGLRNGTTGNDVHGITVNTYPNSPNRRVVGRKNWRKEQSVLLAQLEESRSLVINGTTLSEEICDRTVEALKRAISNEKNDHEPTSFARHVARRKKHVRILCTLPIINREIDEILGLEVGTAKRDIIWLIAHEGMTRPKKPRTRHTQRAQRAALLKKLQDGVPVSDSAQLPQEIREKLITLLETKPVA